MWKNTRGLPLFILYYCPIPDSGGDSQGIDIVCLQSGPVLMYAKADDVFAHHCILTQSCDELVYILFK